MARFRRRASILGAVLALGLVAAACGGGDGDGGSDGAASGLTGTITDTVTGTVGSLLGTLPSALLGGPDAPQVDTVFQAAFAQEDVTHTALAADSQQSDAAASFLHMGGDLLPFAPVELPALNLGFMGQS